MTNQVAKQTSRSQGLFRWPSNRGSKKPWVRGCFLAANLAHGLQKNITLNVNTFALISCQIFVVDLSKTSSFFAFQTCWKILLCNSIAIVHYFWKTKILNLKTLRVSDRFSCMIHRWSVARQPDKHVLGEHVRKLSCHFRARACGRIVTYPLANLRANTGALPLNELIN